VSYSIDIDPDAQDVIAAIPHDGATTALVYRRTPASAQESIDERGAGTGGGAGPQWKVEPVPTQ